MCRPTRMCLFSVAAHSGTLVPEVNSDLTHSGDNDVEGRGVGAVASPVWDRNSFTEQPGSTYIIIIIVCSGAFCVVLVDLKVKWKEGIFDRVNVWGGGGGGGG